LQRGPRRRGTQNNNVYIGVNPWIEDIDLARTPSYNSGMADG